MQEFDATKVINGTFGYVWIDGERFAEVTACQAKDEYEIEEVAMCGRMHKGHKITGITSKGSLKMHHVNSRLIQKIARQVRDGFTPTFTVITKLADPSSYGCERMTLFDVVFEDLTIADWEHGKLGEREMPFRYRDYMRMDVIE